MTVSQANEIILLPTFINIVTLRPNAGIVKSEKTSILRQLLGKHIPGATNTQAAIE
jgi:hypothetical protein